MIKLFLILFSLVVFACEGCTKQSLVDVGGDKGSSEDLISSNSERLDSIYAWSQVLEGEKAEGLTRSPEVEAVGNNLYYMATTGSVYLVEGDKKTLVSEGIGGVNRLQNINGRLWSIEFGPFVMQKIEEREVLQKWSSSDSVICKVEGIKNNCLSEYLTSYNDSLLLSVSMCDSLGRCATRWLESENGDNWKALESNWDDQLHIGGALEFKEDLVVGSWDNGLYAYNGSDWRRIKLPDVIDQWNRPDSLIKFRTRPVIHEGEIYIVDHKGRTLHSADLVNWTLELREEMPVYNYDLERSVVHDSIPLFKSYGFGMLSHDNELYMCNKAARRNFKDSLWQFIASRERSNLFFKERRNPGSYSWEKVPGRCWDMAAIGDKLYAAVTSVDEGFSGLYELDLSIMRDSTWEDGQKRNN